MPVSFPDHVARLTDVLDRRAQIVDAIDQRLLNVQNKDTSRRRDRDHFEHLLQGCLHGAPGGSRPTAGLRGQLAAAHLADGFEPVLGGERSHRLDPLELVIRAYEHWERTRWPGRNGRLAFAHTIYAAFVLGELEHLSLRIWDDGSEHAQDRLRQLQRLLDRMNADPIGRVFVRDARWLTQTAQGPLTRQLGPYFTIAERIASSFDAAYRIEIHRAGAALAGGHLRSQQRYRALESGRSYDDTEVLAVTRNSNSMDAALLVGDLVPLLEAYERAQADNDDDRRALADVILQGLSADPELLVTRLDLLAPATTIEEVFLETTADGRPRYTPAGERHLHLIGRYRDLLGRLARPLVGDLVERDQASRSYSPLGIAYGFCADVLWNIAASALTSPDSPNLALEDLFDCRGDLDVKRASARTWEQLPTRPGEHEHFTCSMEWAQQVFDVTIDRLRRLTTGVDVGHRGRLVVVTESDDGDPQVPNALPAEAVQAQQHFVTSDVQRALTSGATAFPRSHLLADRREGRYLASVEDQGKWFAVSKVLLTHCLAQGEDAAITGVPVSLVDRLRLTCPDILTVLPHPRLSSA